MPRQTHARKALEGNEVAIAKAYERGKHLEDIAKKYDVSSMTVHNWLKELGYKHSKGRGRYPKAMVGRAKDMFARGWGLDDISSILNVRREMVGEWLGAQPEDNPKGFKKRSPEEKDSALQKKMAELEKRRAKRGVLKKIPDPAKLDELDKEPDKVKRPRGRPPKEEVEPPYPPPRHRCNKHWTEPEERYVLELIEEGKEPQAIYHRMRASKQRQRRIWRKHGGRGDPPNFPPPRTGGGPPDRPLPPPVGAPAAMPDDAPAAAMPTAIPESVVEALSGEISDRARAESVLAEFKNEREKLEKQAQIESERIKRLRTSKEKKEDILRSMLGDGFGDALSNRVLEGSYEHMELGLKPGSRKPLELPSPEELAGARTDQKIKRLVGGAVRQIWHKANRKRLAGMLLDATLEYQSSLDFPDGDVEVRNRETEDLRGVVLKVLEEISNQYDIDQDRIDQLAAQEDKERVESERKLKAKEKKQAKEIAQTKREVEKASRDSALRDEQKPQVIPGIQIPTLLKFIEIGGSEAIQAFSDADADMENRAVADAVSPIYENALKEVMKPAPEYYDAISLYWEDAYRKILPRYAEMDDQGDIAGVTNDPIILGSYNELVSEMKKVNEAIGVKGLEPGDEGDRIKKKRRARSTEIGPRPLRPADYYSRRFIHQQYAPNGQFYRFGPEWKFAYPIGSNAYDIFSSATKNEMRDLSQVLEQRFGFPNKIMMKGSLPKWWANKDKSVPRDVRNALDEAIASFPEIINRLRQRRDQLYKGKAREDVVKALKPDRPIQTISKSETVGLDSRLDQARGELEIAKRKYESKLSEMREDLSRRNMPWSEVDEQIRISLLEPVERAQVKLDELIGKKLLKVAQDKRFGEYSDKKRAYEGELRKSIERKALTEDIASWVGKLGEALKAKSEISSALDPSIVDSLDKKYTDAMDSYIRIWEGMSEPDKIILASNLKFADLRGRPTERGVKYARYLSKKYDSELQRNPGTPWINFCKKNGIC